MFNDKSNKFHAYSLYVIVCYSYVSICYSYVFVCYSYVTRMLLVTSVCSFSHGQLKILSLCRPKVIRGSHSAIMFFVYLLYFKQEIALNLSNDSPLDCHRVVSVSPGSCNNTWWNNTVDYNATRAFAFVLNPSEREHCDKNG